MKRGRMTPEEKAEIVRLCDTLKEPTPGRIALRLDRCYSTVNWYMVSHGLIERPIRYARPAVQRNGTTVHPYTPEQDRRLLALRATGLGWLPIAETLTAEFGIPRNRHSVQIRGVMLAAYTGDEP